MDIDALIDQLIVPAPVNAQALWMLAETQWQASLALAEIGAPAVPALIGALNHPMTGTRVATMNALRDMGAPAAPAAPAISANFHDADPLARRLAIGVLGYICDGVSAVLPALLERMAHDEDFENRGAAAWVIHCVAEEAGAAPGVVEGLAAALTDDERIVRLNAAAALGAIGTAAAGALPALTRALEHPDQYMRIYAADAIGSIGGGDATALTAALATISDDSAARERIRDTVERLTGARPLLPPEPEPPVSAHPWAALGRDDFLLATQPVQTQRRTIDQDRLLQAFLDAEVCNAFCFWPDHTFYNVPLPTPDQMARWRMTELWYFFTEDIFNPRAQRDWGYRTITEYNQAIIERILAGGRRLGRERCIWSVGHEQFDAAGHWRTRKQGVASPPVFQSKEEGYDFYRTWITTDIHKNHWNADYGNNRPSKFYHGWDAGDPVTWQFVERQEIDLSPVSMMSGGVCPALAHAAFDILPQIGWYWWEGQIDGASLQIGAAYARGAARQYGRQWLLDASPWSPLTGGMKFDADGNNLSGVTDSQQMRTWLYGYFAGAGCVFEEASNITHFRPTGSGEGQTEFIITSTGRMAKEVADFCFRRCPERGVPYAPVGVLLEHLHGFEPRPHTNFRGDGAWYYLPRGDGEWEIERFWQAVYPGHSEYPEVGEEAPLVEREPRCLHQSVVGDVFDVLTDRSPVEVLMRYPRLLTLGGIQVSPELLSTLRAYVEAGGQLLLNVAHLPDAISFGPGEWLPLLMNETGEAILIEQAMGHGKVILSLAPRNLAGAGEESAYLPQMVDFLREWIAPVYPLRISTQAGHPSHFMVNRLADGWLVIVGNHYPDSWQGTLSLDMSGTPAVAELFTGTVVEPKLENRSIIFDAEIPPFAFRAWRCVAARA